MQSYLLIALLVSLICGLAIVCLRNAPARLRFYICLLVFAAWLTPWPLLQMQMPATAFVLPIHILADMPLLSSSNISPASLNTKPELASSTLLTLTNIMLLAFALGLALFIKDLVHYFKLYKRWIKSSAVDNQLWQKLNMPQEKYQIRRLDTSAPGMATGLIKPIIWLSSKQTHNQKLRIIVQHELTHIRQHDPLWLWLITLVQRLCWWNPLIWLAAPYAKQQIELSCDEQCKKHLPDGSYQQTLIELTLQANKAHHSLSMPAALPMSGSLAFNLKRIYKLNEEQQMKKRYVLVIATLLSLTSWIGFSNATINTQQSIGYEEQNTRLVDVLDSINNKDFSGAQTQLDKIASNINSLEVSQQAKTWKLYAHVLYELDAKNPQVIAYIDKALALEEGLTSQEILPLLNMAQALAASQERWDKQLSYAKKWFDMTEDSQDNKQLLYMTAVSHYSLQQFDSASTLLNKLVLVSETQGQQPKEIWLKLLMAIYMQNEDTPQAYAVQEKITQLYPSDKNQKLLNDLGYML